MTPERLAFTLREDDFLWVKLGRLKPKCEPLRYHPPDEAARQRAAEIRRVVEEDFGDEVRRPAEPRFDFVRAARHSARRLLPGKKLGDDRPVHPAARLFLRGRVRRSAPESPIESLPRRIAGAALAVGVNGVWLHAVLRDLRPGGTAFPEFGADHQRRLANLRCLGRPGQEDTAFGCIST